MKQTAVEWLVEQIKDYDFADIKDNEYYFIQIPTWILKEKIEQAKEMEKEQIIEAWNTGTYAYNNGEQYYNETYTKDVKYYLIECGEDIRNTILFDITDQLKKQGHYFIVNATSDPNQFDIKRVTKQQFDESNT
jgi:hypothetical protein